MFSEELRKLLIQVISSWQVLVVTVVLVLYVFLVNYVARIYHRSSRSHRMFPARPVNKTPLPQVTPSESDDLLLEDDNGPQKK